MIYECSKRLIKVFHFIVVSFKALFITAIVLIIGTTMLSVYSIIDFVSSMAIAFLMNPEAGTGILIILLAVPIVAHILEKGLTFYLQQKEINSSSS